MSKTSILKKNKKNEAFRIAAIIAKILYLPVLILSCIAVMTFTSSRQYNIPNAFGFSIIQIEDSGQEFVSKSIKPSQLLIGDNIAYFHKISEEADAVVKFGIISNFDNLNGVESVTLSNDSSYYIPLVNIIGIEAEEELPDLIRFVITNFHTLSSFLLYAILPLAILSAFLIIDTVLYFKDKKQMAKLSTSNAQPAKLTKKEEEDFANYEELSSLFQRSKSQTKVEDEQAKEEPKFAQVPRPMPAPKAPKAPKPMPAPKAPPIPKAPKAPTPPKTPPTPPAKPTGE